jgi:hypothetical protein
MLAQAGLMPYIFSHNMNTASVQAALRATLLFSLLTLAGPVSSRAAADWSWQKEAGSTALLQGGQTLWCFRYGASDSKPCFHPVAPAGGPVLTGFRPADHPWHRGLWFSWKYVNGVNYWEEDKATGKAAGTTRHEAPRIETRPDFSARIQQDLAYLPAGGAPVLTEQRQITLSAPDAEGGYWMDWDLRFTALTNVVLDRTPLPNEPEGKPYGGYAGLSVRFAGGLSNAVVSNPAGPVAFTEERFRGAGIGMDYTGEVGGRPAGVAILDHPLNLNAPSPWYAINGKVMHFYSPAVLCNQPHRMKAGEQLRLRYRVLVHAGAWAPARLTAEHQAYVKAGQ